MPKIPRKMNTAKKVAMQRNFYSRNGFIIMPHVLKTAEKSNDYN